jgi:hypothetical protein
MGDVIPGSVIIQDDAGGTETVENVADVAEMVPGRLQVVFIDETREVYQGALFGGWGHWKMWIDTEGFGDGVEKHVGENPLTMPRDFIRYKLENISRDVPGTIKRLKRSNL